MKTVKISGIILLFTLIIPTTLSAIDFGFYLNNNSTLIYDKGNDTEIKAEQRDMLSFWMSTFINEDFYFKVKAHLEIGTQLDPTSSEYKFLPLGDIDTFMFGGKIDLENSKANYFSFKVGRMFFSDFTQELAFTPIDGFSLGTGFDAVELSIVAGYTGLIYNWSNTQRMSYNDATLSQSWGTDPSENYSAYAALHGAPKFIGNIEIKAPSLFKGQDLYFNILAQADLWQFLANKKVSLKGEVNENFEGGSPVHTIYAGTGLRGAITSNIYYNLFGYFGTGVYYEYLADNASATGFSYQPKAITSGLLGFDIEGYIEKALYSRIAFSARYSSGDKSNSDFYAMDSGDNTNSTFLPLNVKQVNTVFNPMMSNISTLGLEYSFKPFSKIDNRLLENFMIGASIKTFMRSSTGAISEVSITEAGYTKPYLGTELDFLINLITISDFNLFLTTGVFFPNGEAFIDGYNEARVEAELNFSISL